MGMTVSLTWPSVRLASHSLAPQGKMPSCQVVSCISVSQGSSPVGLLCTELCLPKFMLKGLSLWPQNVTLFRNTALQKHQVKIKSLQWTIYSSTDWRPNKSRSLGTNMQRERNVLFCIQGIPTISHEPPVARERNETKATELRNTNLLELWP